MRIRTIFFALFILFGFPMVARANSVADDIAEQLQTSGRSADVHRDDQLSDPRILAASIIQVALSLMGTVFFLLTVYAGFLWMTARGDDEKVNKAIKTIRGAVIGLAVVLSAYAVTGFVTRGLLQGAPQEGQSWLGPWTGR